MNILKADFGSWHVQYVPDDGARIASLKYGSHDLLTSPHDSFSPPGRFYGEYETRPVFGYDDCFPTVDPCVYPEGEQLCRDHGELCWQRWRTEISRNSLICSTDCPNPEVNFKRILIFEGNVLKWRFEVTCLAGVRSVFLHVMHALMRPDNICELEIPECRSIIDEITSGDPGFKSSAAAGEHLLTSQPGFFGMLLLKTIGDGVVRLGFINGLKMEISFDHKSFPTLGIWWNNGGYPEEGRVRTECAFEPIPGTCSDLSKSFRDGVYLSVEPGEKKCWEVVWTIK